MTIGTSITKSYHTIPTIQCPFSQSSSSNSATPKPKSTKPKKDKNNNNTIIKANSTKPAYQATQSTLTSILSNPTQ